MSRSGAFCTIIAVFTMLTVGVQQPLAADGTEEVKRLEQALGQALLAGNAAAYGGMLAGDYAVTNATGDLLTWDQEVARLRTGEMRFEKLEIGDLAARRFGKTVIVTGKASQSATLMDREVSGEFRFTRVWIKGKGGWKAVAAHYSRIAVP
ncbi:MAG: nuclear transport factor 2 family protein [Geobacteraceae bacterium]|nr:nuclear transport factor 2 family protein [Geobacteraceae bacterium]